MSNKKLLISYDYFLPAYKAGGPVQSISNFINNLHKEYQIFVITSNSEFGENVPLKNIKTNEWVAFKNDTCKVYYLTVDNRSIKNVKRIIEELNPDVILANNLYSLYYTFVPAFFYSSKTILNLRGALLPGAFNQKRIKKAVYINILKCLKIHKRIQFSVTDIIEKDFSKNILGKNASIQISGNFPSSFEKATLIPKNDSVLKLLSIALISPMKNHLLVIEALKHIDFKIEWYIYGPIKDKDYWDKCKEEIEKLPSNIKIIYSGEIEPVNVHQAIGMTHFFVLPSKSENFGHALYEALISGRPIITSHNTPWIDLEVNSAGYNVTLTPQSIAEAITKAYSIKQEEFNYFCDSARKYAQSQVDLKEITNQNINLINSI